MTALPAAVRPFVEFPAVLRRNGFPVAPDQTMGFIEAVGLLGPDGIDDVRRAAHAMLAIPHERRDEFEAIFRAFFHGETVTGVFEGEDESAPAHEPTGRARDEELPAGGEAAGVEATAAERLSHREFAARDPESALLLFARLAPARLPRRRSYRHAPDRRGRSLDMRRTLRAAARHGGEVMDLSLRTRKSRQRRIVLLVDVSGSMAGRTDDALRFSHALARAAERLEAFTLGTRLTRITAALRRPDAVRALAGVSGTVADMDGGTRIGEALQAFLAVPRYAGFARGAQVVVLSDGLERGGPEAMADAVRRLARIAWRIDWLSPLATEGYEPRTAGIAAVLPHVDALADGSDLGAIVDHLLGPGRGP